MFSSRFLLMSIGAALGGWTAAHVGYSAAFVINAISFVGSAYSVWLLADEETRSKSNGASADEPRSLYRGYWSDMREGWTYIVTHAPVATILGINILWATGGGAGNLIADRLGALVFAENGISPDSAVAAFYFAGGFGLFVGLMIARRVSAFFELRKRTVAFIGWSLFIQGVVYAFAGVMPTLIDACVMVCISRVLLGAEFAVQETLLMRLVPDNLRGRVSTSDRAGEMLIWAFSTAVAGWSLHTITPRTLTVISGVLSATAGLLWLVLFVTRKVRLPKKVSGHQYTTVATD